MSTIHRTEIFAQMSAFVDREKGGMGWGLIFLSEEEGGKVISGVCDTWRPAG